MNIRTREEILQYVIRHTENFQENLDLQPFTASAVADEIKISRNLASSYLNDMVKEELLVKVGGRPVSFLHKKTLEKQYHLQIEQSEFDYPEDFWETAGSKETEKNHSAMIGFSMSLNYCVSQCKAAIKYPETESLF